MVENLIVSSLFRIKGDGNFSTKYIWYEKMKNISNQSFKNSFPQSQHILLDGEYDNLHQAFKDIFIKTYNLWKERSPCNILFHDVDSFCIKPFPVFEISQHFSMFNVAPSNPKEEFPLYYNSSLRYFSHDMNERLFEIGLEEWNKFDPSSDIWDYKHTVYNRIFYHPLNNLQDHKQFLKPEYNYLLLGDEIISETQSNVCRENAFVIQMSATRGHKYTYEILFNLTKNWKLPSLIQDLKILNSKLMDSLSEKGLDRKIIGNLFYHHSDGDITLKPINNLFETKRERLSRVARLCNQGVEIGLGGGHSALLMLTVNPSFKLIGNDIVESIPEMNTYHPQVYVPFAVDFLNTRFGDRFEFVKGSCIEVIPQLVERLKAENRVVDLIHIDGMPFTYYQDFCNLAPILKEGAYVIFDDSEMTQIQWLVNHLIQTGRLRRDPDFPSISLNENYRNEILRFIK